MKLVCLDDHPSLAQAVAEQLGCECLIPEQRQFPDGEFYFRLDVDVSGEDIVLFCHLHQPNEKALAIWLMAGHLREMGAARVGLVAPYLAYMRQDIRFHPGECVTSRYFARLLNASVDFLITVDPHLHRYHSLSEIYQIPSRVIHANPLIARWIASEITDAVIIGPDEESAQWAQEVAQLAGCPVQVLTKTRHGDRDVEIHIPDIASLKDRQPVLVDDIISTGRTLIETAQGLVAQGLRPPVCIGVHAVLSPGAEEALNSAPIARWLTCNSIPHRSNAVDLASDLAAAIREMKP